MFHMLSCFNLRPGETAEAFQRSYNAFFRDMQAQDLVLSTGPVGRRRADTPMDTDNERHHEYFVVMSFRDRPQVDAAYAHIQSQLQPQAARHHAVFGQVQDAIFICWEDL